MHFGANAVGQMGGAAPQAMPLRIFQERQQSRCPRAAAYLGTPAKCIGYFLTDPYNRRASRLR